MIILAMILVFGVVCVGLDRVLPVSPSPDDRLVRVGAVIAGVGAVFTFLAWWAVVPVFVLVAGAGMVLVGRRRTASAG